MFGRVVVAFIAQTPLDLLRDRAGKDEAIGVDVADAQHALVPGFRAPEGPHAEKQRPRVLLGVDGLLDERERVLRRDVVVLTEPDPGRVRLPSAVGALRLADAMEAGVMLEPVEAGQLGAQARARELVGVAAVGIGDYEDLDTGAFGLSGERVEGHL